LAVCINGAATGQTSGFFRPFGEMDTKFEEPRIEEEALLKLGEFTPVERPINPDEYVLGPGDVLGVNIVTAENLLFTLRVNPTGDLLIPTVGIVRVAGLTLSDAINSIREFVIKNAYRNSIVDVTLVNVRTLRVLVVGAVQDPGFVLVTAADRVTEVITEAGGLHKYADEESIKVIRPDSSVQPISLKTFLLSGDLEQNPTLREGDWVEVPFLEDYRPGSEEFTTYNESAILVTGFVKRPGAFRYFPGYTVRDYIGMAGGVLETGTVRKVEVFRSDKPMNLGFADFVRPGDTIYIPSNIKYIFFGKGSMIQIISATAAMLLTYDRLTQ
jgi:polysaccharide export outer membrane protein|tara:strand:- start:8295 stop:9278 length:984 start_codon:yes stop_codon:yes gene_type:complete